MHTIQLWVLWDNGGRLGDGVKAESCKGIPSFRLDLRKIKWGFVPLELLCSVYCVLWLDLLS